MTLVLKNRVRETTSSTGTGTLTLLGAVSDHRSFASVMSINDTTWVGIVHPGSGEWEVGLYTYSSANTLTRTTVYESSNTDLLVNFTAGLKDVFIDLPASRLASRQAQRDDAITTGGTSTAYTISTEGFGPLASATGKMIAFVPHTTNGLAPTLNIDGLGAKPLRSAPGVSLAAGVLVQGTPYVATYNNAAGECILHGFYGDPYGIPIGMAAPFLGTTAPNSSFVLPFGQALSRATYATLFSMVGTTFGIGDGSTTFNIIDLRGRIPVPQDNMGGSAAGRITTAGSGVDGATPGATGGAQNVTLDATMIPAHSHAATVTDPAHVHTFASAFNALTGSPSSGSANATGTSFVASPMQAALTGITVANANTGGGLPHSNMPPTIIVPWILRVI